MSQIPEKGKIIISEPFLNDPNFKRSIVLLSEHNEEGSIGFILNKPTNYYLNQIVEDFPEFRCPVYFGGPVQTNSLMFIHRVGDMIDGSIEIFNGLYWGGSFEILKILIETGRLKEDDFKFFIGYSGWSSGQLEEEMKLNSWIVTSVTAENIFSKDPDNLWRDVLKSMGKKFALLASFPENPSVN